MESNGLPGGMISSMGSGMLGLEMSVQNHHQRHIPQQQNPSHLPPHQHHPMVVFGQHEADHHPQAQQSVKQGYPYAGKAKNQQLTFSDEDEPGGPTPEDSAGGDGNRKTSPWQRMKWTDSMVRLLIMVVFYIGDEAGSEGNDPAAKKKSGTGVLQKKGKWKSVSRAMMERGFYVSPQQCEDKFNDLNKRYKRVNDILGKGTACRVVENQSLLETMDHLSPKMKEEVKKLLNSKHLFFREMCAYHNSCGGGPQQSAEAAAERSQIQQQPQQQKRCSHSTEIAPNMPISSRADTEGSKMMKGGSGDDDDDEDDEEEDEDEDEDEEEVVGGHKHNHDDGYDTEDKTSRKRPRKGMFSPSIQQFTSELKNVEEDGTKSSWEKRQWMRMRLMQLEEQRVRFQLQAFELEKEKMKWLKFSSKKERDLEAEKLGNERMKLENERMLLLLRQKELELPEFQQPNQSSNKRGEPPSTVTG